MTGRRRGRPPRADSVETRAQVLAAARRLFGEQGYSGTSLEQIAGAAGVTSRAIYHYVDSKEALFVAAATEAMERLQGEVAARVLGQPDVKAQMTGFIEAYRALYRDDPTLLSFIAMASIEAGRNDELPRPLAEGDGRETLRALVLAAAERGELAEGVDVEGATSLLGMFAAGLMLSAQPVEGHYEAMLDALQLLLEGTLLDDGGGD